MDGICSSTSRLQQPSIVSNASIQQWPYLHDVECQYTRVLLFQCVPRSTRRRSLWESFYFISSLSLLGGTIASHASTTSLLHAVNRKIQNKCQKQGQKGREGKESILKFWNESCWFGDEFFCDWTSKIIYFLIVSSHHHTLYLVARWRWMDGGTIMYNQLTYYNIPSIAKQRLITQAKKPNSRHIFSSQPQLFSLYQTLTHQS